MKFMFTALLCLAAMAHGSTYYVSTTGSNGADGSQSTPWATIDHAADNAAAGDTVRVAGGMYREMVTPGADGATGNPIVLWTDPADRAVINGADVITGWTQCTQSDCPGNPEYASIYYADVAVYPVAVFQDGEPLQVASIPAEGWYRIDSAADGYHITDPAHLDGAADYLNGSYLHYWTWDGHNIYPDITGYDAASHTMALDPYWIDKKDDPMEKDNIYRIMNHLPSLLQDGRYCVDSTTMPGRNRLYVRPAGGGSPDGLVMEVPVRRDGIELRFVENVTFHGFEIKNCINYGFSGKKAEKHITVENMFIHHNGEAGIYVTENNGTSEGYLFRDCVIFENADGIISINVDSVTAERCHIFSNRRDGMKYSGGIDMVLRDSYIHHHVWMGHPDGIQYTGVDRFLVENTAIVLAGQVMMSEGTSNGRIVNCLGIGAGARAWIADKGAAGWTYRNTTAGLSRYSPFTYSDTPCSSANNIMYAAYNSPSIGTATYSANNLSFLTRTDLTGPGDINADPLFINTPKRMFTTSWDKLPEQSKGLLYLNIDAADFADVALGDHIEINHDGVVRTINGRNATALAIMFTPALEEHPWKKLYIFNWKEKTDFAMDLRPAAGSPALGAGTGGSDIGCNLNLPVLNARDFDGDGLVDLTGLPVGMSGIAGPGIDAHSDDTGTGLKVFPNPVRSTAVITADGPVEIFDANGTMVLRTHPARANNHSPIRWGGTGFNGHPVENGTYYVRSGNTVQRIMVIR